MVTELDDHDMLQHIIAAERSSAETRGNNSQQVSPAVSAKVGLPAAQPSPPLSAAGQVTSLASSMAGYQSQPQVQYQQILLSPPGLVSPAAAAPSARAPFVTTMVSNPHAHAGVTTVVSNPHAHALPTAAASQGRYCCQSASSLPPPAAAGPGAPCFRPGCIPPLHSFTRSLLLLVPTKDSQVRTLIPTNNVYIFQ